MKLSIAPFLKTPTSILLSYLMSCSSLSELYAIQNVKFNCDNNFFKNIFYFYRNIILHTVFDTQMCNTGLLSLRKKLNSFQRFFFYYHGNLVTLLLQGFIEIKRPITNCL